MSAAIVEDVRHIHCDGRLEKGDSALLSKGGSEDSGSNSQIQQTSTTISISESSTITDYHSMSRRPFYGRQKELKKLQQLYERSIPARPDTCMPMELDSHSTLSQPRQAVLIAGVSGTGKTSLIREFLKQFSCHSPDVLIMNGKYEEMHQTDPFSALEQAFNDYIYSQKIHKPQLRESILEAVGEEGRTLLGGIIPAINTLFVLDDTDNGTTTGTTFKVTKGENVYNNTSPNHTGFMCNRLQYLFARFVAALAKPVKKSTIATDAPRQIILVLDDLHWADPASLDLLAYLLKADIPNLFLLGTYRSDYIRNADIENQSLLRWSRRHDKCIQTIQMDNHSKADIGAFLLEEVCCDSPRLLDTIYNKTQGNFFFTMQVVEELLQKGFLFTRNPSTQLTPETCNCAENEETILKAISQFTSKYHSVKDALSDKIERLSTPLVRHVLVIASYLRSQFRSGTLHSLLLYLEKSDPKRHSLGQISILDLNKMLDEAVLEGLLINNIGSDSYRFAHDGIQEASCNLVPAGLLRDQLLFDIGCFLKTTAHQAVAREDWMIFVAARCWAAVAKSNLLKIDPIDLATLNSECGTQSLSMAAVEQAAVYFRQGLQALTCLESPWQNHYQLTLHLYLSLAEMELVLGNYETGYCLANQVLDHAHTLDEKVQIYHAMDYALGMQERHNEALKVDMQVLEQLNDVPGTMTALRDIMQVRRYVKTYTNEEILNFPVASDPNKLISFCFLAKAAVRAYCTGNMLFNVSCIIKQTKMAFECGLCSEVAMAFALYGSILAGHLGDPTTGRRMGQLAREVVKKPENKRFECETLFLVAAFIELWFQPYAEVIDTFEYAHTVGLAAGNYAYGYACCYESISASFVAGVPLGDIADSFCKTMVKVRQYNLFSLQRVLEPLGVLVFHLLGRKGEAAGTVIDGTNTDWDQLETIEEKFDDSSNHLSLTWQFFVRMILAYYLDEVEVADRMSKKFMDIMKGDSYTFISLGCFYSGLINIGMYRKTGRRKFKWRAQSFATKLGKTVKAGGSNNTHKYHLLQAEIMGAFRSHGKSTIKEMYDRSIIEAAETGCIHEQALANELAGEYFWRRNDNFFCGDYFAKALLLYKRWGAQAKADLLMQKRRAFINRSSEKVAFSSSVKSALRQAGAQESIEESYPILCRPDELAKDIDDVSGLTPIGEFNSYNNTASGHSRWESNNTDCSPSRSLPPKVPKRSQRLECNEQGPTSFLNDLTHTKPPRIPKRYDSL